MSIVTNIVKNEFSSERMIFKITILSAASINSDSASFLPRSACSRPSRSSSISAFIGDYKTKFYRGYLIIQNSPYFDTFKMKASYESRPEEDLLFVHQQFDFHSNPQIVFPYHHFEFEDL